MKKFLKHIFFFGVMAVCILTSLAIAVDRGLRKTGLDNFPVWAAMEKGSINANLLIAGSSRAWVNVSPLILDTALRLNTYNLGLDGHHFHAQWVRYKFYEKYTGCPDYIIHCLDLRMLTYDRDLYMPEQYAPYLSDSIIYEGMKEYNGYTDLDYVNPFTKYMYKTRYIGVGLMEFFGLRHWESRKDKGYEGQDLTWDNRLERALKLHPRGITLKLHEESIALFEAYISECKQKNIRLILVYPPDYVEGRRLITNRDEIMNAYQVVAEKYHVPFLNYSDHTISGNKDYFYNSEHLNKKGAEFFSGILASDLKNIPIEK